MSFLHRIRTARIVSPTLWHSLRYGSIIWRCREGLRYRGTAAILPQHFGSSPPDDARRSGSRFQLLQLDGGSCVARVYLPKSPSRWRCTRAPRSLGTKSFTCSTWETRRCFQQTTAAWESRRVLASLDHLEMLSSGPGIATTHTRLRRSHRKVACLGATLRLHADFLHCCSEGTRVSSVERQHWRGAISPQHLAHLSGRHSPGVGCDVFLFDATIAASLPAEATTTSRCSSCFPEDHSWHAGERLLSHCWSENPPIKYFISLASYKQSRCFDSQWDTLPVGHSSTCLSCIHNPFTRIPCQTGRLWPRCARARVDSCEQVVLLRNLQCFEESQEREYKRTVRRDVASEVR